MEFTVVIKKYSRHLCKPFNWCTGKEPVPYDSAYLWVRRFVHIRLFGVGLTVYGEPSEIETGIEGEIYGTDEGDENHDTQKTTIHY